MSSLNNLYISQSYQGLVHFGSNTTATSTLGIIEDGLGNSLGLYLNNNGDLQTTNSISSSRIEATTLVVKNKIELTGSVDVLGSVTASNALINNNLIVSGTISAYAIHTTIESSSIIFSSGSNILGDSILDTQTLNGTIIMSGSNQLTGSLTVSNDISSSTLNGVGNVTAYSQSVQNKFNSVNSATASLFTSASLGLTTASVNINVLTFTKGDGSQFNLTVAPISFNSGSYTLTSSFNAYTSSANSRLNNLESTSASVNISLANINSYTASNDTKWSNLQTTTASFSSSVSSLSSKTGSYATTGSNTFIGNEVFSGSVRGGVTALTINSNTASIDCSTGNFFTLTLVASTATNLQATNINPGQTIGLKIIQPVGGYGTVTTNGGSIRFPQAFPYIATPSGSAIDILSFQSYDTTTLYGVAVNTMR